MPRGSLYKRKTKRKVSQVPPGGIKEGGLRKRYVTFFFLYLCVLWCTCEDTLEDILWNSGFSLSGDFLCDFNAGVRKKLQKY